MEAPKLKFVPEVPPAAQHGRTNEKRAIADLLRRTPGRWILWREGAWVSYTTDWQKLGCATACRNTKDGKADIYVCWPKSRARTRRKSK